MAFETTIELQAPTLSSRTQPEIFERFQSAETKIAIQKDGELTEISRFILEKTLGVSVPVPDSQDRKLIDVSDDGVFGFVYAKNKGICSLVGRGAVDLAVIGIDRVVEDSAEDAVDIVQDFRDDYSWPLVLATKADSRIGSFSQIKRVATQYPRMTERFFKAQGVDDIEIIPSVGSTELFPYLNFDGEIDAIIDMSITGRSLEANNLVRWSPQIANVYPVLIQPKKEK